MKYLMKYIWTACLILGALGSLSAKADESDLAVESESAMHFTRNFDAKIKALESYTVTFDDGTRISGNGQTQPVPVPATRSSDEDLQVQVTLVSR